MDYSCMEINEWKMALVRETLQPCDESNRSV